MGLWACNQVCSRHKLYYHKDIPIYWCEIQRRNNVVMRTKIPLFVPLTFFDNVGQFSETVQMSPLPKINEIPNQSNWICLGRKLTCMPFCNQISLQACRMCNHNPASACTQSLLPDLYKSSLLCNKQHHLLTCFRHQSL